VELEGWLERQLPYEAGDPTGAVKPASATSRARRVEEEPVVKEKVALELAKR